MLTPQMVKEAIATSHDLCKANPNGCVHADALQHEFKTIESDLQMMVEGCLAGGHDIFFLFNLIYNHAIHVGYRLHQLETEPISTAKVN
jgi:hypothetical protein